MIIDMQAMLTEASERMSTSETEVEWYSWPEVLSSTLSGAAHSGVSTYQIFAFRQKGLVVGVKHCAGKWRRWRGTVGENWFD